MKLDFISIFPEFFEPLKLSLLGKAQSKEILSIGVHDLREQATNNHKQVDDTPYGGGAGMVMMPEVWGKAIDSIITKDSELIILTPAGKKFDQRMAEELSQSSHLIFACGRYEGIDDRVRQYYEAQGHKVREVSIGDYVLNGGEVAAIVIAEAVVRLIPGVLGNPESIVDESHAEEGYIEYPAFTFQMFYCLEITQRLLNGENLLANHAQVTTSEVLPLANVHLRTNTLINCSLCE
jgi:tRNA (guanine37-N1)-methyltransferase